MTQLFSNNAQSQLTNPIGPGDTSITVDNGALFRQPTGAEFEIATLTRGDDMEIVRITGRSGNVLTVVRAIDGTTAQTWLAGNLISGRITRGTLERLLQNNSTGTNALATGPGALAAGDFATSLGQLTVASGHSATAVGRTASAAGSASLALGYQSSSPNFGAVAIGADSQANANYAEAIGHNSRAGGNQSVSIGRDSRANSVEEWTASLSVVKNRLIRKIGSYKVFLATNNGTTGATQPVWNEAIIGETTTDGTVTWRYIDDAGIFDGCVSAGWQSRSSGWRGVAIGMDATSGSGVSIGNSAVSAAGSVAIGRSADCRVVGSIAVGNWASCRGVHASSYGVMALGENSQTLGAEYCIAIGADAQNRINNTYVIAGLSLVRQDDGGWQGYELPVFGGSESLIFGSEIDLKQTAADDLVTLTMPSGATFFVDEVGIVTTEADTVTVQPQISFGTTSQPQAILAQVATTKSNAHGRDRYTSLVSHDGFDVLTFSLKVAATATTLKGRPYFKGVLVEDQ